MCHFTVTCRLIPCQHGHWPADSYIFTADIISLSSSIIRKHLNLNKQLTWKSLNLYTCSNVFCRPNENNRRKANIQCYEVCWARKANLNPWPDVSYVTGIYSRYYQCVIVSNLNVNWESLNLYTCSSVYERKIIALDEKQIYSATKFFLSAKNVAGISQLSNVFMDIFATPLEYVIYF